MEHIHTSRAENLDQTGSVLEPGKTEEGSITVLLTSCLTGLESAV
jgi:hypothetical protein